MACRGADLFFIIRLIFWHCYRANQGNKKLKTEEVKPVMKEEENEKKDWVKIFEITDTMLHLNTCN